MTVPLRFEQLPKVRQDKIRKNLETLQAKGASEDEIESYLRDDEKLASTEPEKPRDAHGATGSWGEEKPASGRSKVTKALDTAAQGAAFGFSDEIGAAANAAAHAVTGGRFGEPYREGVQRNRSELEEFRQSNPKSAVALELAGGLAGAGEVNAILRAAGVADKVARGATAGQRIARAAAEGSTVGAVTGAGTAEGGFSDRAAGAAKGAAAGAALGTGLGSAAEGLGKAATKIRLRMAGENDAVASADRAIVERLRRDGLSLDDAIARAQEATDGKPMTLLEVGGKNTKRLARAARTQPSKGSAQIDDALSERSAGTEERLFDDLLSTTGLGGRQNAFQRAEDMIKERSANARPLYDKAFEGADLEDPEIHALFRDHPQFREAWQQAAKLAHLEDPKNPLSPPFKVENIGGEDVVSMVPQSVRSLDRVKKGLDAMIESRAGSDKAISRDEARLLRQRVNEMLERVDQANPDYAAARSKFRGDSELMDAFDLGRQLFKLKPDEIETALTKMKTDPERDLFRRGGLEALGDRIEGRAGNRDPMQLGDKTIDRKRVRFLFPDDDSYAAFQKRLGEEGQMHASKRELGGNSQTADKLAELADMTGSSMDMAVNVASGNAGGIVRSLAKTALARRTAARLQGVTEQRADALANRFTAGTKDRKDLYDALQAMGARSARDQATQEATGRVVGRIERAGSRAGADVAGLHLSPYDHAAANADRLVAEQRQREDSARKELERLKVPLPSVARAGDESRRGFAGRKRTTLSTIHSSVADTVDSDEYARIDSIAADLVKKDPEYRGRSAGMVARELRRGLLHQVVTDTLQQLSERPRRGSRQQEPEE